MIISIFAGALGALATFVVLLPYGWLVALLCAPFGGSALTLVVAVGIYTAVCARTTGRERSGSHPFGDPETPEFCAHRGQTAEQDRHTNVRSRSFVSAVDEA
jgi:hypothetical protein